MQHLREIIGDNKEYSCCSIKTEQKTPSEAPSKLPEIKLDGNSITPEGLQEAQNNKSVRIIEVESNNYKTLQHLR